MEMDFIHIFIAEAEELLETLEINVLDLEKNKENPESINQVFRVMHTLKGTSDMFGFSPIRELTHLLETLFDQIRTGEAILSDTLLNLTFQSIDHFRNLLKDSNLQIQNNKTTHQEILKNVGQLIPEDSPKGSEKFDNLPERPEKSQDEKFCILFKPDENIMNRGINLLEIFKELHEISTFTIEELQPTDSQKICEWKIILETDKGIDAISDVFMFVLNNCEITPLDNNPEVIQTFNLDAQISDANDLYTKESLSDKMNPDPNQPDDNTNRQFSQLSGQENNEEVSSGLQEQTNNIQNTQNYTEIGKQVTSRVNVDASKLDKLMNLVSELVTTNTQLSLIHHQKQYDKLTEIVEKVETLSRQFRDNTLSIRLIPINDLIVRFRRLIRDLSIELGKDIRFITEGMETELDKNIIDNLAEPLMHILRNSVDHGIETATERISKGKTGQGTIKLSAFHAGANVFVQIQDDGKGLELDKIKTKAIEKGLISHDTNLSDREIFDFIFTPGFSTSNEVTRISGRGVGMDVVKRKISEMQGDISIESESGLGTLITIKLHQTISIIDSLLIKIDNSFFLIPNSDIDFCIEKHHKELETSQNQRIEYNNKLIPYINLRELFKQSDNIPTKEKLIIVNKENHLVAIVADEIIGEHQAVIKPLGNIFHKQDFLVGASIMGNGNFAFMLDINKLIIKNNNKKEVI
jgi:two-component system, chemotaxis family, sensor kinase CheA